MSDVHHLGGPAGPAEFTHAIGGGLAVQQRERETALHTLARLRKQASEEIARLIEFLDASDAYVMTEAEPSLGFPETNVGADSYEIEDGRAGTADDREDDGDGLDASYPEGGERLCGHPNEDDEAEGDDEHSLGFIEQHPSPYATCLHGADGSQDTFAICAGLHRDLEDEHDGAEGPNEDDEDAGDDEPSLGSFDRMTDQSKSWRHAVKALWLSPGVDAEADQCA